MISPRRSHAIFRATGLTLLLCALLGGFRFLVASDLWFTGVLINCVTGTGDQRSRAVVTQSTAPALILAGLMGCALGPA